MRLGLTGRLILLGVLCAVLVAAVGGFLLRSGAHQAVRGSFAQRLSEHADRIEARFERDRNGRYAVVGNTDRDEFGRIISGWYWRLQTPDQTLRSRSLWDARLRDESRSADGLLQAIGPQETKLLGITRALDGGARLDVFGPAAQVDDALARLDRILLLTMAALVAMLVLTAIVQARLGLRPLARLRAALAAMDQGRAERIGVGYGPDLDPLARELDQLLTRNARVVARARGHAADLAHALKKPLAILTAANGDQPLDPAWVRREAQSMARLIDRHLARAGSGAGERRRIAVQPRVSALVELMRRLHAARGLQWDMDVPDEVYWRGEATDLEEMLGNLLDNAGKWARSRVGIRVGMRVAEAKADPQLPEHLRQPGPIVYFEIEDDGAGLSETQRRQATQRGRRFDESTEGSGLGLAIVCDIAETYGGTLELEQAATGGLLARLSLPA